MRSALLSLLVLGLAGCADLSDIQPGVCGNGVIDEGEDCDSTSPACGAPVKPEACRFACAVTNCPFGYACGSDKICRAAGSKLVHTSSPSAQPTRVLDIGDFDGDGFGDVLGARPSDNAVFYHGPGAVQVGSASLPSVGVQPSAGVLTPPRSSFVVANGVVSVARGLSGRTLEPKSYSPFKVADNAVSFLFADLIPVIPGEEIISLNAEGNDTALVWATAELPLKQGFPGVDATKILGNPIVANLDLRTACDELGFALEGSHAVQIHRVCAGISDTDVIPLGGPTEVVALPLGHTAVGPATLAYLDGDTRPDLFIRAKKPGLKEEEVLLVAYGVGNGSFHSSRKDVPDLKPDGSPPEFQGDDQLQPFDDQAPALNWWGVLAAGDLNLDGKPDFVLPSAILMSGLADGEETCAFESQVGVFPKGYQCALYFPENWTEAFIGYFNDDAFPDVSGAGQRPKLDLLLGTGSVLFNAFEVPSEGQVSSLTLGDFDGDFITDFAFKQTTATSELLGIALGNKTGGPSPPIQVRDLGSIQKLATGHSIKAPFQIDWVSDLGVISEQSGARTAAIFYGSTQRLFEAPYHLFWGQDELFAPAIAGAIGRFDGDAQGGDLAILSDGSGKVAKGFGDTDVARRLWLLPTTGDANIDATKVMATGDFPSGIDPCTALLKAVDLDGNGSDELIVVAPQQGWQTPKVGSSPFLSAMLVARAGSSGFELGPVTALDGIYVDPTICEESDTGKTEKGPGPGSDANILPGLLVASDLEGRTGSDARPDVLALVVNLSESKAFGVDIAVFKNDGNGNLATTPVILQAGFAPEDGLSLIHSFALFNYDRDPQKEIVLLTNDGAWVGEINMGAGKIEQLVRLDDVPGGSSVVAGDIDADGVDDLVFGGDWGAAVFRGQEVER